MGGTAPPRHRRVPQPIRPPARCHSGDLNSFLTERTVVHHHGWARGASSELARKGLNLTQAYPRSPATQLRIDRYVGSLEPGKDADFAIWSKSPLDSGTVCLQTWIDGRKYFD